MKSRSNDQLLQLQTTFIAAFQRFFKEPKCSAYYSACMINHQQLMHCPPLSSGIITAETRSVLFNRALGRTERRSFRLEKLPALTFCTNQDFITSPWDINETLACTPSTTSATIFANKISEGSTAIWIAGFFYCT